MQERFVSTGMGVFLPAALGNLRFHRAIGRTMAGNACILGSFMAKRSPSRKSRVFTVSFPPELAKQVDAVAKAESRTISELFREAFRTYAIQRRSRKLEQIRAEVAQRGPSPYTEDDVERLVDEVRAENLGKRKKTA